MAERKEGFGRTALITGASSGIGLELSRLFAAERYNLVVAARSTEKLKTLATQLESEHQVRVRACPMDLSQPQAVHALWSELTNAGVAVDVLVNNAGVGLYGDLWEQDADELRRMLILNVEVLTLLTRYALPGMVERGWGRILNLASLVAYQPGGPRMAAYYASKAYVLSFSKGLAVELRGTGVTVTALCPGLTGTEFMKRSGATSTVLDRTHSSSPVIVARQGLEGLMRGRGVVIPGVLPKLLALTGRLSPGRIGLAVNERLLRRA
jgi:short-subunit dehydrogenase